MDQAQALDEIETGPLTLKPLIDAIPALPRQAIDDAELARAAHGNPVPLRVAGERVALVHDGQLAAIAVRTDEGLHPKVVMVDA